MNKPYASGTPVPIEQSQGEIMGMLGKVGIKKKGSMDYGDRTVIAFEFNNIQYKLTVEEPGLDFKNREAEARRRWRVLVFLLKSKLVGVAENAVTFEEEFLQYAVCPDGRTMAEVMIPQLKARELPSDLTKALSWRGA